MAMTRGRPSSPNVRKGAQVGPDYPDALRTNPWDAELSSVFGNERDKAICSENSVQFDGADLAVHDNYDRLWEGR